MKMHKKAIIIVAVLLTITVAAFFYFYVSGKTVANLFSEYKNYEITITKSSSIEVIDSETVLTADQKEMLIELFREASFRRVIANTIYTPSTVRYEIRINGTHQANNGDIINGVLFFAESTGGEYLLISGEFSGKHLKIYNNQWDARIDEILNASQKPLEKLDNGDISSAIARGSDDDTEPSITETETEGFTLVLDGNTTANNTLKLTSEYQYFYVKVVNTGENKISMTIGNDSSTQSANFYEIPTGTYYIWSTKKWSATSQAVGFSSNNGMSGVAYGYLCSTLAEVKAHTNRPEISNSITGTNDNVEKFLSLQGDFSEGYENDVCHSITPRYILENSEFLIFKYDTSCASFLLYDGEIYPMGRWFSGYGVTDVKLADIDNDNELELYFTFSWGSGIHRSQAGYFNPKTKEVIVFDYSHWYIDMIIVLNDEGCLSLYRATVSRMESFVDFALEADGYIADIIFENNGTVLSLQS